MFDTEMATLELSERFTEDLRRLPLDEVFDALESAFQNRQGDFPTGPEQAYRNFALDIQDFRRRNYELCDAEDPDLQLAA